MIKVFQFMFVYILFLFSSGISILQAGDNNKKTPAIIAAPKDLKAEARIKDSITYFNLTNDAGLYTYQTDTNDVLLYNGVKLHFVKTTRLPVPRGVFFTYPDTTLPRSAYDLVELEMTATNTNSTEVKLDGSEPLLVSVKLYSTENNWKAYPSQYVLSFGSFYLRIEPPQPEKMNAVYIESHDFLDKTYKAGQIKNCKGIVVAIPKTVRHFDRIVVYTREFGQNRSYGCPGKL